MNHHRNTIEYSFINNISIYPSKTAVICEFLSKKINA